MLKRIHIHFACTCLVALIALTASASSDQPSNIGQVVVDAPKELVKRNNSNANKSQQQAKPQEQPAGTTNQQTTAPRKRNRDNAQNTQTEPTIQKPKRGNTSQQTISSHASGFRIQAYSDNNSRTGKAEAQKRAREISTRFPAYRSYISYKAPSWRLRVGDFKTKEDAQAALRRLKSAFPQIARGMVVVKDNINVWQ